MQSDFGHVPPNPGACGVGSSATPQGVAGRFNYRLTADWLKRRHGLSNRAARWVAQYLSRQFTLGFAPDRKAEEHLHRHGGQPSAKALAAAACYPDLSSLEIAFAPLLALIALGAEPFHAIRLLTEDRWILEYSKLDGTRNRVEFQTEKGLMDVLSRAKDKHPDHHFDETITSSCARRSPHD